jgi:hypothetical protein
MINILLRQHLVTLALAPVFLGLMTACATSTLTLKNETEGIVIHSSSDLKDVTVKWSDTVQVPPIGFVSTDPQVLTSEKDCFGENSPVVLETSGCCGGVVSTPDYCSTWFRRQTSLRSKLNKLFARQWKSTGDQWKEVQANEAFQSLLDNEKEALKHFKPNELAISTLPPAGAQHRYLIPWDALPPAESETLDKILIRVGPQKPFQPVLLDKAKKYQIGKCDVSLAKPSFINTPSQKDNRVNFFVPMKEPVIDRLIALDNPNLDGRELSEGISPTSFETSLLAKEIGNGWTVCGPKAVLRGPASGRPLFEVWEEVVDPNFGVKPVKKEHWLLFNGPKDCSKSGGKARTQDCLDVLLINSLGEVKNILSREKTYPGDDLSIGGYLKVNSDLNEVRYLECSYQDDSQTGDCVGELEKCTFNAEKMDFDCVKTQSNGKAD